MSLQNNEYVMKDKVLTYGCRLNHVESQFIDNQLEGNNNVIVVNSCAVTQEAGKEIRKHIRRLSKEYPEKKIIVTGCGVHTETNLYADLPQVTHLVGNTYKLNKDIWKNLDTLQERVVSTTRAEEVNHQIPTGSSLIHKHTRGMVAIQTGCDHRCTFCTIPFGRGRSTSLSVHEVVEEIRACLRKGCKDVILTGVDLTSYGKDLQPQYSLGSLLSTIFETLKDTFRLRLSSLDAIEIDHTLVELFATERRLMPFLHLSLQSGDNLILKRMKRRHSREDAIELCDLIRSHRPEVVFGADFIVGFPTESDLHFAHTRELVKRCGLTYLHVFPFSPRQGTPAARMPQLDGKIISERANILRQLGAKMRLIHHERKLGKEEVVLAETHNKGRLEDFTPVQLMVPSDAGELVRVRIVSYNEHGVIAQPISS